MKVAIMTQPLGRNYGGIMQAWALQQVLKRMGHEPVTIDRRPPHLSATYRALRFAYRFAKKSLGKRSLPINFERHLPTLLRNTQDFLAKNVAMSEPLFDTRALKEHFGRSAYDAVIVGSDQTWRPGGYSPNIYNFFLDFLQNKSIRRIAYATSFGVDEWEFNDDQTRRCAELAKRFDAISVREDSGMGLCRKHFGVDATAVLDPSLLLDAQDYENLLGADRLGGSPSGIYTYFLDKSHEKTALAKRASDALQEPIRSCQAKYTIGEDAEDWLAGSTMPDIRDWLAGFANARFVITDSFHGMAFSIVFRRPFIAVSNASRGNARFSSLARATGYAVRLEDQNCDRSASFFSEQLAEPAEAFHLLRSRSVEFLRSSLDA